MLTFAEGQMSTRAAVLAGLLIGFSSDSSGATLNRDWARVYNPPGNETTLGMWPAVGGGVEIAVDRDGELTYVRYDQSGSLAVDQATGVGNGTFWFRAYSSDDAGGFVVAALQDSANQYGLIALRISTDGQVLWRTSVIAGSQYPRVVKTAAGKVYIGADDDYLTTYDPSIFVLDMNSGAGVCSNEENGYYFRISDIEVLDDGRVSLIGYDNGGCDCFAWVRAFNADCSIRSTNTYPGLPFPRFEHLDKRNIMLTTSLPPVPFASSSFAVTWFIDWNDVPAWHLDSRDFMTGGVRAQILEKGNVGILIGGEHDAGNGARELMLGTPLELGGLDIELVRPNPAKSYAAIQLASTGDHIVMLGAESNVGGSSPKRILLLFDIGRNLEDFDVEGNIPNPFAMAIGEDGGVYTVGGGGSTGIVLTKLLIGGAVVVADAPPKAPTASRLGIPSPNPATSSVRLEYDIAGDHQTTIDIYDPAGRLVARLVDGARTPGHYVAEWDTRNVAKGVYLARFKSGNSYATRKIVID